MIANNSELLTNRVPDVRETLRDLKHQTMGYLLPALYVLGLLLILAARGPFQFEVAALGLLLVAIAGMARLLLSRFYLAAAAIVIGGCCGVIALFVVMLREEVAVTLAALPIGLAVLLVNRRTGMTLAVIGSLLLVLPTAVVTSPTLRLIALIQIWSMMGTIWLTYHSLLTAMFWFRDSSEHSGRLLERARDHQVEMAQLIGDFAEANRQLTRLHKLANSLRQVADTARRTKEEFVANVSHELRTPLNMIIGFTELVLRSPQTYGHQIPPALLADLDVVLRNSQHLSALIDDVLDLSQIEAGQMALSKEWTDLGELVQSAIVAIQPLFEAKHLLMQVVRAPVLPPVYCDPVRIRQVILNLLSNAARFTAQGGITVQIQSQGQEVVVSVTDTGPGIAPTELERLFQPFQQADNSIRKQYGGNGLGLSISKGFVELHHGMMWGESTLGQGTSFHFRLPIAQADETSGYALRWFSPHDGFGERSRPRAVPTTENVPRIVVQERGNSMQRLLARYLDRVEIVSVSTLAEAMRELEQTPSHLYLINEGNVGTALQQVELAPIPNGTPALICSMPSTSDYANSLGATDYLLKPVSRTRLLEAIAPFHARKVLLIDDDPDLLRLFRRILASADRDYQVLRASDGHEGLHLMAQHRPDVVLLDLIMPDLDGFQLLAQKNQDPALRDIPVLIVSSQDPTGQPIVSRSLAVTTPRGLSAQQLLGIVDSFYRLLSPQVHTLGFQRHQEVALTDGLSQEAAGP